MKKIISILFALCLLLPLFSLDWGGNIFNTSAYKGETSALYFDQTNRATLWLQTPLNTSVPVTFSGDMFYEFGYDANLSEDSHILDISTFKFNVVLPVSNTNSKKTLDIGRFMSRDLTGLILAQPLDGVKFNYKSDTYSVIASAGYTGFLNEHSIEMNVVPNEKEASSFYALAAPFVVANATLLLPELFSQQNVFFEVFAAVDMAQSDNRMYTSAALNGPITPSFYYTLTSTLGLGNKADDSLYISNMSTFELTKFLPYSSLVSWKTVYATGGDFSFNAFTIVDANISKSLPYTGYLKTGVLGSIRPITSLLLLANADLFVNTMNDDAETGYAGAQWLFSTRWEAASDLHLFLSAGQFLPADAETDSYFKGEFKFIFNF